MAEHLITKSNYTSDRGTEGIVLRVYDQKGGLIAAFIRPNYIEVPDEGI